MSLSNLTDFLIEYADRERLLIFAHDQFNISYQRLTANYGLRQLATHLVEIAQAENQVSLLAEFAQHLNPPAFERHQPTASGLDSASGPITQLETPDNGANSSEASNLTSDLSPGFDQREQMITGNQYNSGRDIHITEAAAEAPFWQRLSRANLVIGMVAGLLGILGVFGTFLAVPQINERFFPASPTLAAIVNATPAFTATPSPTPSPLPTATPLALQPARNDEILILIATFYETTASRAEPHVKIRRAIEKALKDLSLSSVRVGLEPTILTADDRAKAERLAEQYRASIVVWGEETSVEVVVNFLNLKGVDPELSDFQILENERVQLNQPEPYIQLITRDLPTQLTFLSLFAVGQTYRNQGEYRLAAQVVEQGLLPFDPADPDKLPQGLGRAYSLLGWLYQAPLAELDRALTYYSQAIALNDERAYNNRATIYIDQGQFAKAEADFAQSLALDPNDSVVLYNRAFLYHLWGKDEAAVADYSRVLALKPGDAASYHNRGNVYAYLQQFEPALADFEAVIEIWPDYPFVYNSRANIYKSLGLFPEALADYGRAISLKPDYARAYFNRGLTHAVDLAQPEEALVDFSQAIALQPGYTAAIFSRALTSETVGDTESAIQDYQQVIELNDPYYSDLVQRAQDALATLIPDLEAETLP